MNVPCVPLLHTAVPDLFHAGQPALFGYPWLSQIGLQAWYLVVRRVRLLGFLGSPKFEQALYRPTHKGSTGRSGTLGQGAHSATSRPVAVSAPFVVPLCGLVWDPLGNPGKHRAPAQEPRRSSGSFAVVAIASVGRLIGREGGQL